MILNRHNCSNPFLYGKELKYVIDGQIIDPILGIQLQIPDKFDFFNEWCSKDMQNAREYYKIN